MQRFSESGQVHIRLTAKFPILLSFNGSEFFNLTFFFYL